MFFYKCEKIKNITLPEKIRCIEEDTFFDCTNLESIIIPGSVTRIGHDAFFGCKNLNSITIPSSLTSISYQAFLLCDNLENVYYDGSIIDWCNIKFEWDNSTPMSCASHFYMKDSNNKYSEVTKIEIPSSVKSIGDYQFFGFSNISEFTILEGVEEIGAFAFAFCSIKEINLPSSINEIQVNPFKGCNNLDNIFVNKDNNKYIVKNNCLIDILKKELVVGCNKSIIPDDESVMSIGDFAFSDLENIVNITIPKNIKKIGEAAFYYNDNLENVVILNDDIYVSDNFINCPKLKYNKKDDLCYIGSINNPYLVLVEALEDKKTLKINENTKFIMMGSLDICESLTNIIIGKNLVYIHEEAFLCCPPIEYAEVPPCALDTLGNDLKELIINSGEYVDFSTETKCKNLTKISLPSSIKKIKNFNDSNFPNLLYNKYDKGYYLGNNNNPYLVLVKADCDIKYLNIHKNTKVILDYKR